jgi:hypothetical protein
MYPPMRVILGPKPTLLNANCLRPIPPDKSKPYSFIIIISISSAEKT